MKIKNILVSIGLLALMLTGCSSTTTASSTTKVSSGEVSSSNTSAIIKLADDTVVTGNVVNYYTASFGVVVVTLDSGETYQVSWLNCTIVDRVK